MSIEYQVIWRKWKIFLKTRLEWHPMFLDIKAEYYKTVNSSQNKW